MGHFTYLEHTADIGIEARADSPEELARQAGLALAGLLYEPLPATGTTVESIAATGNTAAETLVNWLNELLYYLTERQLVPAEIKVRQFAETVIHAELRGERFQPQQYACLREIKAVTHHQAAVIRVDRGWRARIYLDL